MRISPATCRPITIRIAPPTTRRIGTQSRRRYPTSPRDAHRATNTMVKPRTKASDCLNATRPVRWVSRRGRPHDVAHIGRDQGQAARRREGHDSGEEHDRNAEDGHRVTWYSVWPAHSALGRPSERYAELATRACRFRHWPADGQESPPLTHCLLRPPRRCCPAVTARRPTRSALTGSPRTRS